LQGFGDDICIMLFYACVLTSGAVQLPDCVCPTLHCFLDCSMLCRDVFKSKYLNVLDFVFGNTGGLLLYQLAGCSASTPPLPCYHRQQCGFNSLACTAVSHMLGNQLCCLAR
jgi:hypothetical protein